MAEASPPTDHRIAPWRIGVVFVLFVAFLLGALGYHDGTYATTPVSAELEPGSHRFKGVIESYNATDEFFMLRDDSGSRRFHWNVTEPALGHVYVVNADFKNETLEAVALSRALLFR